LHHLNLVCDTALLLLLIMLDLSASLEQLLALLKLLPGKSILLFKGQSDCFVAVFKLLHQVLSL